MFTHLLLSLKFLVSILKEFFLEVKSEKRDMLLLSIIPNDNFEKLIQFLILKTLLDQTLEFYISTTINGRYWVKDSFGRGEER